MAKWLSGTLEHDDVQRLVVPHLLAQCAVCRERHAEILRLQKEVGHWDPEIAVVEGRDAPELWARLADLPYAEQLREVEDGEDLHTWGLCRLLLRKSREATFSDPARGVELANLALRVVRHLGAAYDPGWVLELRARCFAALGNARRVLGELRSADDAFVKAESCLARDTAGNLEVEAEILDLKSSLRRAQRRLGEALELIDRALALYRELGDAHGTGKSLFRKPRSSRRAGTSAARSSCSPGGTRDRSGRRGAPLRLRPVQSPVRADPGRAPRRGRAPAPRNRTHCATPASPSTSSVSAGSRG